MAESVCVGVRVRPFNAREKGLNATVCISMDGPTTRITDANGEEKPFTFDESFWSHDGCEDDGTGYMKPMPGSKYADQRYVFETFGQRVLNNAWNGFHCCLFAYGQTGAGKSYSMVGYGNNKGIVPISCEEIFTRIGKEPDPNCKYEVTVSMIEIYNEAVQDLLIEPDDRPKKGLEIRESKALGIYIDGVLKRPVDSYPAIEATIEEATNHRTVGSTLMNATSSRAHTVQIIEFKAIKNGSQTISMINLVDLAGSEKAGQTGATGDRLKEGSAINKSLSALGNVIEKLAEKATSKGKNVLVPYRDSKLTRLLQNALGGSSKTIMICALSPASSNYEETLSTLRYSDRAKKIKNTAVVNENPQERLMRELREENEKLKQMVESMQGGNMPDAQSIKEMGARQQEIAAVEAALADMGKSFEQKMAEAKEKQEAAAKRRQSTVLGGSLGRAQPMMVNLNEDKTLTGRIRHTFGPGRNLIGGLGDRDSSSEESDSDESDGGSDNSGSKSKDGTEDEDDDEEEEPDITVMGEGIFRNHAIVMRGKDDNCKLYAAVEEAAMTTCVNGHSLSWLLSNQGEDDDDEEEEEEAEEKDKDKAEAGGEDDEPKEDWEKQDTAKTLQKKPKGKGVLLKHGDRLAFARHFFVFVNPSEGLAEVLIASGQVDYAMAKHEWTLEQRTSMMRRATGLPDLGNPLDALGLARQGCDLDPALLAEKDEIIAAQREEIAALKQQLEAAQNELAALRAGGGLGAGDGMHTLLGSGMSPAMPPKSLQALPASKWAGDLDGCTNQVERISVTIKKTFNDAIEKMNAVEAALKSKKTKADTSAARFRKTVSFHEDY